MKIQGNQSFYTLNGHFTRIKFKRIYKNEEKLLKH